MANFLVTSPNSLTQGTDSNDLFVLNTALGATVYGAGGNDQLSAADAVNGVNAILNGGQGNDSIFLTAGAATLTVGKVIGGGGSDITVLSSTVVGNSTVHGGDGADTINIFSGTYTQSTINGNGGHDNVSASGVAFVSSLIALGAGNDSVTLASAGFTGSTLLGGGGNDRITGSIASGQNTLIQLDTLTDSEFYGNDTIQLGGAVVGTSTTIQGGGGADVMQLSATFQTGAFINGNAGKDSIFLSALVSDGSAFIAGGNGADTITVSSIGSGFGTINGGGQDDLITVTGVSGIIGGTIFGGEGADTINLGLIATGSTVNSRYTAFSQSNLAAFDFISANSISGSGATFVVSQDVVSASVGANLANGAFTTDTGGLVTWVSAAGNGTTARATQIDSVLTQGQSVVFQNGAGESFLFIQAGSNGSGTDADFIAQLYTATIASGGLAVAAGTAITLNMAG